MRHGGWGWMSDGVSSMALRELFCFQTIFSKLLTHGGFPCLAIFAADIRKHSRSQCFWNDVMIINKP